MHILCKTSFPFQAYEEMEMSSPSHPDEVSYPTCEMGHISHGFFIVGILNQLLGELVFNLQKFLNIQYF